MHQFLSSAELTSAPRPGITSSSGTWRKLRKAVLFRRSWMVSLSVLLTSDSEVDYGQSTSSLTVSIYPTLSPSLSHPSS